MAYIVEETIGSLIDEIKADIAEDEGLEPGDKGHIAPFLEQVRDLTVLDPAMGSGHFLTKATGYLTEQVMEVIREQEIQSYDEQDIRRIIARDCIYGVDINGMAVELAKLSMWLETLAPETMAENAPRLETVVQLLNRPALARVHVHICYWGPVAPPAIMDVLELSKSTTYEYIDQLVDLGLVDRDDSTRPQQLTADPIIIVEQYVPIVITPTVLHALALQETDEDVEYFLDRYGLGKLIAALRGAGLHFAGKTTQRMVASDIDIRDTEAMMIIYALRPALIVGRDRDPFFEHLFPDVHDAMDLPTLEEMDDLPPRTAPDE